MPVNPDLVAILACPKCKGPVEQTDNPEGFGCANCNLFYKTEDDIPNFLIDEATPWNRGDAAAPASDSATEPADPDSDPTPQP